MSTTVLQGRVIRLAQITGHICRTLGVEFEELTGNGRRPNCVLARWLIWHLARRLTTLSYPELARATGRPTHSTCITGCQRLEQVMEAGGTVELGDVMTVRELHDRLEAELLGGTSPVVRHAPAPGRKAAPVVPPTRAELDRAEKDMRPMNELLRYMRSAT